MKAALILPLVALAACGSDPEVKAENASVAEVQAQLQEAGAEAVFLSPGRWESTVTIDRVDIPGMPPELAQRMKRALSAKTTATCLTPEEAKKPAAEFFAGKDRKNCRYDRFEAGGGAIDARMTCGGEGGGAVLTMKGDYGPETFRLAMTVDGRGMASAPQGAMSMAMRAEGRHAGACRGNEQG